jgi:hypothetical protein
MWVALLFWEGMTVAGMGEQVVGVSNDHNSSDVKYRACAVRPVLPPSVGKVLVSGP